jgi:serine/threonine-protein kinase
MLDNTLLNNRYRVLRLIGSGGCGQTFLAEDTHLPSRHKCVVKILKPATNDPGAQSIISERFHREAAILEKLGRACRQIPVLYAHFSEGSEFYLVQEWVEGRNLLEWVAQYGVFTEKQVIEFLSQMLSIIKFTHSEGIIHRDIKPENIMINDHGIFFLIDFGAVKEVMTTVVSSFGTPSGSIIIGSQGYMPIEQATGRPVFASDLYCLGLTAIFLLTGKSPQELMSLSTGEILWKPYVSTLNPGLVGLLEKAIENNYLNRYRSAQEMLDALMLATPKPKVAPIPVDAVTEVSPLPEQETILRPVISPVVRNKSRFSPLLVAAFLAILLLFGISGAWFVKETNRIKREAEESARLKQREIESAKQKQLEEQQKREAAEKKQQEEAAKRVELEKMQPQGKIEKVWVDYDYVRGNRKGLLIHTKFSVNNLQSVGCLIAAYFYYENGDPLKDYDNDFYTAKGDVAVSDTFSPKYVESEFDDYELFIPTDELLTKSGTYNLKFQVQIRKQLSETSFDSSEYVTFKYTSK